jgi:hypothetical protein
VAISLFSFNFRLGPWEGCLNLNFDQIELAPGFAAVCTRDHLGILWGGDPEQNEIARATAYTFARALIHADAFLSFPTGIVLEVEPVTWLEVRDCVPTGELRELPTLQFALGDFYTARREVGPYSAFYAFRVLEDVGFHFGVTKNDKPDWDAMNAALGTSKAKWDPLTEAGTGARHLSGRKLTMLETIDRATLLCLAHEAVKLTLNKIGVGKSS